MTRRCRGTNISTEDAGVGVVLNILYIFDIIHSIDDKDTVRFVNPGDEWFVLCPT